MTPVTNDIKHIKAELHHWWPQCVAKRWSDENGKINQLFYDGRLVPHKKPRNIGGIRNGHLIKLNKEASVWDQSFENIYSNADNSFPDILTFLSSLKTKHIDAPKTLESRFLPQEISDTNFTILLECLLSLVVRSPRFRNSIKITTEDYRHRFGMKNPKADKTLINLNLRDTLKVFKDYLGSRGKIAVLFSKKEDFIFGDGFYHNFTSSSSSPNQPTMMIPLLPNLCILYSCPMSYFSDPKLVTINLNHEEVKLINSTTMVYSKDNVFYRSHPPQITEEFSCNKFLEFEYNKHPAIELLINSYTQNRF